MTVHKFDSRLKERLESPHHRDKPGTHEYLAEYQQFLDQLPDSQDKAIKTEIKENDTKSKT